MLSIRHIIPILMISALVFAQGLAAAVPSGGGCLRIGQQQICVAPGLRATAEAGGDLAAKKCLDCILPVLAAVPLPVQSVTAAEAHGPARSEPPPGSPWKPPRLSA